MIRNLRFNVTWNQCDYSVNVKLPLELSDAEIAQISKSVYEIYGSVSDPSKASQGSVVILKGVMITNAHVAGDSSFIQVQINGQWQKISDYSFVNKKTDVMGFKIYGGTSLPYSTAIPQKDEVVYALGTRVESFETQRMYTAALLGGFVL